ncbi:MAG: FAD-dependent monooxygenase [Oscillospiraceae bacterium]
MGVGQRPRGREGVPMIVDPEPEARPRCGRGGAQDAGSQGAEDPGRRHHRAAHPQKSLDARRKDDIHYVYTVGVTVHGDEQRLVRRCRSATIAQDKTYPIPHIAPPQTRPVIVGFGPAGMFAALLLARAGARPIVLERGPDAQDAQRADRRVSRGRARSTPSATCSSARAARARSPTASSTPARTTRASASCSRSSRRTARRSTLPMTPSPTSARTCSSRSCRTSGARSSRAAARCASATA